jgi:cyanophycinase-like exopeptidase
MDILRDTPALMALRQAHAQRGCCIAGTSAGAAVNILGLWIEGTEGAKFWMKVFNDLKTRAAAAVG